MHILFCLQCSICMCGTCVCVYTPYVVFILYYIQNMNNHIYSTLFKIQERKSDRRSREIEQRKELQNTYTHKTRTCDLNLLHNIKSPSSLNGLEKYMYTVPLIVAHISNHVQDSKGDCSGLIYVIFVVV